MPLSIRFAFGFIMLEKAKPQVISYEKLFRYEFWANREAAESLRRANTPPAKAVQVMAHIVGSGRLWLSRLQRETSILPVWPELAVGELDQQLGELQSAWQRYLGGLSPAKLDDRVEYVNSKGEKWTSRVADILMHVILHSAYHRGQVAMLLRQNKNEPAYTDYIHAVRQNRLD